MREAEVKLGRSTWRGLRGLVATGLLLAAPELAAEPLAASTCPALFGSEALQTENQRSRLKLLHWVHQERAGITVAHSHASWEVPVQLQVSGLGLDAALVAEQAAVLEVSPALAAAVGCAPGRYRVAVDAALGQEAALLAVLDGLLLLEHEGRLAYLLTPAAAPPPCWLMAWRVRGTIPKVSGGPSAPPPARPPARPSPRRR